MEGALFLDAGNIWLIKDDPRRPRPGASFKWNKFYNDIAIGTGSGLRFDFSFFLIGIDYGFKLRDPAIQTGSKWIDANSSVNYRLKQRGTFQFVIGYPF
jgi:outer membrane protein assembly factor BamA